MPQDYVLARLLANNAQWAAEVEREDPGFFARSAQGQSPKVLYIGCSDSRVPESVATLSKPGDIFTHRNIANQFHLHDDNALSVLTYAVAVLGVSHIIVAGHTHCGGVQAAFDAAHPRPSPSPSPRSCPHDHDHHPEDDDAPPHHDKSSAEDTRAPGPLPAPLARWLAPLTELARGYADVAALGVANVRAQVAAIAQLDVVKASPGVQVHGWMYHLEEGRFRDLHVSKGEMDVV